MTARNPRRLETVLDCRRAFQQIARECLVELRHREAAARRGDAEAIHRMRIALTKLRSARKFFAAMTRDAGWPGLKREIRWLNAALGAARDSDVAAGQSKAMSIRSAPATREIVSRHVTHSHRRLTRALHSKRYHRFAAALARWIEAGPWVTEPAAAARQRRMRPLADHGRRQLARWKKRLSQKADRLSNEKQRHRLRIEAKRFRYMSEALKRLGVPESGGQASARKAAARVQNALGDLRDIRRFRRKYARRHPDRRSDRRRKKKLLREATKALRRLA